mmetsp:Transcript_16989/g.26533  ORF Transcript_16989/g.26533 Transcript_16989/m.26533 type:complete len:150 (-) Transcript_16989:30-479(-)
MFRRLTVSRGSRQVRRGFEEFFDGSFRGSENEFGTGRAWTAGELRGKCFDDLHKLWYILLKEKNMLMSERNNARVHGQEMSNPERLVKVKKSMARLKTVVGERSREHKRSIQRELDEQLRAERRNEHEENIRKKRELQQMSEFLEKSTA